MNRKGDQVMGDTLLTYAVQTDPDPLQASPQTGDPSLATLTIIVSNSTRSTIDCLSISCGFLRGTNANEFFSNSTGIRTSPLPGWTITQDGATFTATPDTAKDGEIGPAGLTFVLSNIQVNTEPGTTQMSITEDAQPGGTTPAPQATRQTKIPLAKFPLKFHVDDPWVTPPPPIAPGSSVTLHWSGSSDATYELRYEDADGNTVTITHPKEEPGQSLPSTGSYTIDNLQNDTIFYLDVTVQVSGQALTLEKFIPVVVNQPQPKITLFEGKIQLISSTWYLILNWETSHADYCTITGDAHLLNSSSTDDSYKIELTADPLTATYTLTATNRVGSDTSQINVDWELRSVKVTSEAVAVAVSPDNTRIYVADSTNGTLIVIDAGTLQPRNELHELMGPSGIAVSPDGTRIYVTNYWDATVRIFDSQSLQPVGNLLPVKDSTGVAASPDGSRIYVISADDNSLRILDSQTLQPIVNALPVQQVPTGVAASRDGTRIYVLTNDGLWVFSAQTLQPIGNPTSMAGSFGGIAASPDGTRIYVANIGHNTLVTLNAQTLQPIGNPTKFGDRPLAVGCSNNPRNSRTYVGSDTGMLYEFSDTSVMVGKHPA